jgi:hypothetical protein
MYDDFDAETEAHYDEAQNDSYLESMYEDRYDMGDYSGE